MSKTKKKPRKGANKAGTLISDPEALSAIVGSLKRSFSRSPMVREFLQKYRREEVWFKKDGTKAKKPRVFYRCFKCQKEFNSTQVQVDHIEPVVPLNIPAKHMCFDILINRLFCEESNLQILCKADHKEKSQQENQIRQEWLAKTKYIVYQTTNKLNCKKYIGIHKCEDYDDGYLGSGTAFKAALSKYGKDNFYRHILFVYDNIEDALQKEKELVNQDVVDSENYYNLIEGGGGGDSTNASSGHISVICHETGEVFASITEAADSVGISISSIVKILDNKDAVAKNLHFFKVDTYDPSVKVTYPNIGKELICLSNKTIYRSIEKAAFDLRLNYKSLRNALSIHTEDGLCSLDGLFFIYRDEYDPSMIYSFKKKYVKCVELKKTFDSCIDAGRYIKHKNPNFASIAIGRAIREGKKMYKYTWEYITEEVILLNSYEPLKEYH